MKAMCDYAKSDTECRSRQLVAYFGEDEVGECGVCDVCLRRGRQKADVEEEIKKILSKTSLSVPSLAEMMHHEGVERVEEVVGEMLDRGILVLDKDFCLHLA